ncbi:MAG: aminodeoxychorismate synthase component I [Verrucomicrobiota bacterium]
MPAPVIQQIDLPDAFADVFARLRPHHRHPVFLDSAAAQPAEIARHSIIAWDPFLTLEARGNEVRLTHADGRAETLTGDPLEILRDLLRRHAAPPDERLPFTGGAIGWFGYELGARLAGITRPVCNLISDKSAPDLALGFYDHALVRNHATGQTWQIGKSNPLGYSSSEALPEKSNPLGYSWSEPTPDFPREDYLAAVRRIRDYIAAGDVYQVNLTQRFSAPRPADPFALYQRLRAANPAPFAAYLDLAGMQVLSSSPERFLSLHGRHVETRPIKGTRARTADATTDATRAAELLASAKDRAELLMIIDLERNDLGRVCEFGSVRVDDLHRLETYATVHHLVSTVSGQLRPGLDIIDCLRATFPGGSITGAPKIRAMQIIDELEPCPRGPYTGALGWIGFNGDADLSIAIRTIVCAGDRATYHVGAGITWDSDPEAEYQETLDKGRALHAALANAES